jgi:hypothetical protein
VGVHPLVVSFQNLPNGLGVFDVFSFFHYGPVFRAEVVEILITPSWYEEGFNSQTLRHLLHGRRDMALPEYNLA